MYFFNSYDLLLKNQQHNEPVRHTFYINNDPAKKEYENVTLKEGYNPLSSRALNKTLVSKEGSAHNAWVQLDFKNPDYDDNYEVKKFQQRYGFTWQKK